MITVCRPQQSVYSEIQQRERAFYWSAAFEATLRRHGIVNVATATQHTTQGLNIVARGQDFGSSCSSLFLEGPLTADTAAAFGLRVSDHHAQSLTLLDADKQVLGALEYPTCRVRKIPLKAKEVSEPYPYIHADGRWNNRTIRYQVFQNVPDGWQVLWWVMHDGVAAPVALRKDMQIVCSIPLCDLLVAGYAFAPLDAGYYDMVTNAVGTPIEAAVMAQIRAIAPMVVEVEWWPHGKQSAFTVRHDMDRAIADRTMKELLDIYARHGVKASFGVLKNTLARTQIDAIRHAQHELNLHSISRNLAQLKEEKVSLEALIGQQVHGFHSHGGGGSEGFLGDAHYDWGSAAGFSYLEMGGRASRQPHHVVRIIDDLPQPIAQIAPAVHVSLDAGMKPEAHYLDYIRSILPVTLAQREHFVLMNHPDIHLPQLYALIESMALSHYWCATLAEVTRWVAATRGARIEGQDLHFVHPLPEPCRITMCHGSQVSTVMADKASTRVALPR
jgi:hypothetical protein